MLVSNSQAGVRGNKVSLEEAYGSSLCMEA